MYSIRKAAIAGCLAILGMSIPAQAASVSLLVYKLGVDATGSNAVSDVVGAWQGTGGFNEGNATAMSLSDTTMDYKNSWADINWASVQSIDVGMYISGLEVSHIDFSPGTSKTDFYSPGNITSTNYTDLGSFTGNFFSESGDTRRKWFVNQQYTGCDNDTGWFVVLVDGGEGCSWENSRVDSAGRAFLYALGDARENYNVNPLGQAGVFGVTVTYDDGTAATPEPSTVILFATGLGALFLLHRKANAHS